MIIGIGSDLIDIARVEKVMARHGERFIQRIFTPVEIRKSERRRMRAASYAKRFAAKEACAKALGTGMAKGVFWRDMGVVNLPGGKPTMHLSGGAAARNHRVGIGRGSGSHPVPNGCLAARRHQPTTPTKKTCKCRPFPKRLKGFEPSTFCMASRTCISG